MSLVWREQMSVHNTLIDTEHQYLLQQINALEEALTNSDNHDILVEILDHLMEYTKTHFEHEEAIQRKIEFPQALSHKDEHAKLIKTLVAVKAKLDAVLDEEAEENETPANEVTDDEIEEMLAEHIPSHSASVEDLQPLAGLMRSWLVDHIIGNDLKMKPYLQKLPLDFK